jgi:hypothetical protein
MRHRALNVWEIESWLSWKRGVREGEILLQAL